MILITIIYLYIIDNHLNIQLILLFHLIPVIFHLVSIKMEILIIINLTQQLIHYLHYNYKYYIIH